MSGKDKKVIETFDLTKYYGPIVGIEDLNLEIKQGEIFGFLGPNGSGKTTTIRLLLGLIRKTNGRIFFYGEDVSKNRLEILKNIGYLPGDVGLYKDMSGDAFLDHFLRLRDGKDYLKHQKRLDDLKELFKINLKNKIKTYSKGMRQIVGIIQAFMHDPKILILDEPTSGLDPIMQEVFYDLVLKEKNDGKTIFFSTHILSEVEIVCDRVGIIKKGNLIFLEEIEKYRKIVGRNIKIVSGDKNEELLKSLRALLETDKITVKNEIIEFYFKGDMKQLLDCVSHFNIKDFISEIPKIEDVFLNYYKD